MCILTTTCTRTLNGLDPLRGLLQLSQYGVATVVSWYLIEDALDSGPKSIGFPDINPCDGSLSFPDLGEAPFNGSAPVIIYDAACGAYVKPRC